MKIILQEGKIIRCVFATLAILIALSACTPATQATPLPTIPTFTPTFDVSTIVTVTPAPKAECPEIHTTVKIGDYLPEKLEYPSPDQHHKWIAFAIAIQSKIVNHKSEFVS